MPGIKRTSGRYPWGTNETKEKLHTVIDVVIKDLDRDLFDRFITYEKYDDMVRSISYHEYRSFINDNYGKLTCNYIRFVMDRSLSNEDIGIFISNVCKDLGVVNPPDIIVKRARK